MKCILIELECCFFNPSFKVVKENQIKNLQNPKQLLKTTNHALFNNISVE